MDSAEPELGAEFEGYIDWLSRILQQSYRVLAKTGNIVVHTSPRIHSHVRLAFEDLFDGVEFTEVVMRKPRRQAGRGTPSDEHSTLVFCRKSKSSVWNALTRPLSSDEIMRRFPERDSRGRYKLATLERVGSNPSLRSEWHGHVPHRGNNWLFSRQKLEELYSNERIYTPPSGGRPRLKIYANELPEIPIGANWDDIPDYAQLSNKSDIIAQQSPQLLERVILTGTNKGDLVVDPLCGSGVTMRAAQVLERKWIAGDNSEAAIATSKHMLAAIGLMPEGDYACEGQKHLDAHVIVKRSDLLPQTSFSRHKKIRFIRNQPVPIEETLPYEFKEVTAKNPVAPIKSAADIYAVAFLNRNGGSVFWGIRDGDRVVVGVRLESRHRDEVRIAIDVKLGQINPRILPDHCGIVFHDVLENGRPVPDLFVVELHVPPLPKGKNLYRTARGEVFVKTDSGKKKLTNEQILEETRIRNAMYG